MRQGVESLDARAPDELELVGGLNRSMQRTVGIYPEIKHPAWHREHGVDVAAKLLAAQGIDAVVCGSFGSRAARSFSTRG